MKPMHNFDRFIPELLVSPGYKFLRHLCLQVVLFLVTISVFWDTTDEFIITTDRIFGWLGYYVTLNMAVYFNIYFLVPRLLFRDQWGKYLFSVCSMILVVFFMIGLLQTYIYDTEDTAQMSDALFSGINIVSSILSIGLLTGGTSALLLLRYWIVSNQRIDELEALNLKSELSYLKNQINPHFLFNMLNNANIMADEDPVVAAEILSGLEDMLRYQLNGSEADKVNLTDDIRFLNRYLELEKTRRDNFSYVINQEGLTGELIVPPLLFIPFVENAVKHNPDSTSLSYVEIQFSLSGNRLCFICKNSKPQQPVKKKEGGLGLVNIRRRLELLYGNEYILEVKDTESDYTVSLQIKI